MPNRHLPSRRDLLRAGLAAGLLAPIARGSEDDDDMAEMRAIHEVATKAGLKPFRLARNESYLALGDVPDGFLTAALDLCLGLSKDFFKHFAAKGFALEKPRGRMTIVALSTREAFSAFLGEEVEGDVAGMYDLESNRLLLFDNRGDGQNALAEVTNTFVLFHEAAHQLTFNSGLMSREADVPKWLGEGLATYAEVRRPKGRTMIGAVNTLRKDVILAGGRTKPKLLPTATLIVEDGAFDDDRNQDAYASSWLTVYYLMKAPDRTAKLRDYLKVLRTRTTPDKRLDDWTAAFGPPDAMDRELQKFAKKL